MKMIPKKINPLYSAESMFLLQLKIITLMMSKNKNISIIIAQQWFQWYNAESDI